MKKYIAPEVEIIVFQAEDVVTASGPIELPEIDFDSLSTPSN